MDKEKEEEEEENENVNPSTKVRNKDFSEEHKFPIDTDEINIQIQRLQTSVYAFIMEIIQNMFDSNDEGKQNEIVVKIGKNPEGPCLICTDKGQGITKDYNGDVNAFLSDQKATTEKIKRGLKRKGLGMFQYVNISPQVIITSMDEYMIYRIPMYKNATGKAVYGFVDQKPAKELVFQKKFGIYQRGTIVACMKASKGLEKIDEKKLIERIREKWAIRLFESPYINFVVENTVVKPPEWIVEHPPKFMQRMKGGKYDINGNIWLDEKNGNGRIALYQDGYLVEYIQVLPRKCSGYVECNAVETDPGRNFMLKEGEVWDELKERISKEVQRFPSLQVPIIDEKNSKRVLDIALKVINLDAVPLIGGGSTNVTRTIQPGRRPKSEDDGNDLTIGYIPPTIKPDNDDEEKETRKGGKHINHGQVNKNGNDLTMRPGDDKDKRKDQKAIELLENQTMGADRPLWILQKIDSKGKLLVPPLLSHNMQNPENPIYEDLKKHGTVGVLIKMYNLKLHDWFAELNLEVNNIINERIRVEASYERVKTTKAGDLYPKTRIEVKSGNTMTTMNKNVQR